MPYIVCEPCVNVKDKACVEVCPVDCFYEDEKMLYIHPDECIDCGACEPECPVSAIFPEEDVPPQWKEYIALNKDIFQGPNPPGKPTLFVISKGLACQAGFSIKSPLRARIPRIPTPEQECTHLSP